VTPMSAPLRDRRILIVGRGSGIARAADEAGLEELWLWEDCFLSGGVSAASEN